MNEPTVIDRATSAGAHWERHDDDWHAIAYVRGRELPIVACVSPSRATAAQMFLTYFRSVGTAHLRKPRPAAT